MFFGVLTSLFLILKREEKLSAKISIEQPYILEREGGAFLEEHVEPTDYIIYLEPESQWAKNKKKVNKVWFYHCKQNITRRE